MFSFGFLLLYIILMSESFLIMIRIILIRTNKLNIGNYEFCKSTARSRQSKMAVFCLFEPIVSELICD